MKNTLKEKKPKKPKDPLESLLKLCSIKTYAPNDNIILAGDIPDKLYFIVDGSVSVCAKAAANGKDIVLAYLNKNEFIGETGIFKESTARKVDVIARTKCSLAEISYQRFREALKKELRFCSESLLFMMGEQLTRRLLSTSRNLCDFVFLDLEDRIARVLIDLCREPDAITHPDGMQLHISRQEIARLVGCSREVVVEDSTT